MANIRGNSAAIYSTVSKQKLTNANFKTSDSWSGESYYIEEKVAHIKNGKIYQYIRGANKNEIWLFSAEASGSFKMRVSFLDYNDNLILSSSENFDINDQRYVSTYGVAPEDANSALVRIEGDGLVSSTNLQHLKPLIMLTNWSGTLKKDNVGGFSSSSKVKFKGEAEEVRELDSINLETFQEKKKIFIGFTENKSLFNRIEGNITNIDNLNSHGPIKFKCDSVKVPFRDF